MERFYIEKSLDEPLQWACIDQESGIICIFEQGKFCSKKTFKSPAGNQHPDSSTFQKLGEEMEDWLYENHSEKLGSHKTNQI